MHRDHNTTPHNTTHNTNTNTLPRYPSGRLVVFGSSVSELAGPSSDVDLTLLISRYLAWGTVRWSV